MQLRIKLASIIRGETPAYIRKEDVAAICIEINVLSINVNVLTKILQ